LAAFSLRVNIQSWAAFTSLMAVRRFCAGVAMDEVVDWWRLSKGGGLGGICVAEGVLKVFGCFCADVATTD